MELAVCIGRVCGRDPWVVYEWYDFMLSFPEQTPQKWHMDGIYSVLGCIIPLDDESAATEFADIDGCDARRCSSNNRVKKVQQLTKFFSHPTKVVFHYRSVQCLIRRTRTITFPDQPARSKPGIYCSPTRSTCTVNPTRGALQKTRYGGQYSQVCVPPTNLRRFFLAFSRSARPPSVGVAFWGFGAKTHAHRRRACERGRTPEERGEASRKLAGVFLWAATPAFCISTLAGFETPESQCEGVVVDNENCDEQLRDIETRAAAVKKVKGERRRQTEPIADVIDRLRKGRCDCTACARKNNAE